jgi:hypothetical protein
MDIIKLLSKKILFINIKTTELSEQINGNTKLKEKFDDYKDNEKYKNNRMKQLSYYYSEEYSNDEEIITNKIKNYAIKQDNSEILKTNKMTDEKVEIKKAIKEIKKLILNNDIDYIVGYNPYYDINILMNELYRINKDKLLKKLEEMIKEKKIINFSQVYLKMNTIKTSSTQNNVCMEIFKKEQKNNLQCDILNLIEISNYLFNKIIEYYKTNDKSELKNYIDNYFKNNYKKNKKYNKPDEDMDNDFNIYDDYLKYPEKIKIKEALRLYYGKNYDENDYEIFKITKKSHNISLFPNYNLIYEQVCFYGSEIMTELFDIENEEINLNYFTNVILKNKENNNIRLKLKNIYILDYENDSNIINIFQNICNIENYEHTNNFTNNNYDYVIEYDKKNIKKQIEELKFKQANPNNESNNNKLDVSCDLTISDEESNNNKNIKENTINKKTELIKLFYGKQSSDYKEDGFPIDDDGDYTMCGYGKPSKIVECYDCNKCNVTYIITSSAGRDGMDGDYNNSSGPFYKCNKCKEKINRISEKYDNQV